MLRLASFVVAAVALAGAALAAAPSEQDVQGLYEGTLVGAKGPQKVEARLVACGKGTYKLFLRDVKAAAPAAPAAPAPVLPVVPPAVLPAELDAATEGDAVKFTGKIGTAAATGIWADGAVRLTVGHTTNLLKRVVRNSPTLGAKPPAGAIVLVGGTNFDEMTCPDNKDGTPQEWTKTEPVAIQVPRGGMYSKRQFDGSFRLHVEFLLPLMSEARDQGRANSGCFMPNGEEIQVLDSFGMTTYTGGCCGGIYKYKDPDAFDKFSLASAPPLQWQTYDIEYHVQKDGGKPTGKPRVTVFHNGIKIHDNFQLEKDAKAGGFQWQDHGNPVQYRNIWVLPLEK